MKKLYCWIDCTLFRYYGNNSMPWKIFIFKADLQFFTHERGSARLKQTIWQIPARVKFAWFQSVQKCKFCFFTLNLIVFPPKYFSLKISLIGKNRFPFDWCHSWNPWTYQWTVTGRKLNFFDLTRKYFFFSISLKRIIKRLLKLTNQEIFFFKNKDFFRRFQSIILELQRVGLWSPASNASVCNFSILILDLWFRKKPEYSFWNH